MLRFNQETDIIFTRILDEAFKLMISELTSDTDTYTKEELEGNILQYYMAYAKRNFTVDTVIPVLQDLAKYNRKPGLWELNDYHYLVIYDTLRYYCDIQNDLAKDTGEPILHINNYAIYELDFDEIIELYLWDTDFLIEENIFLKLNEEGKRALGANEELFGIVTGLKPHSSELVIKLYDDGKFDPPDPNPIWFQSGCRCYPHFDDIEMRRK